MDPRVPRGKVIDEIIGSVITSDLPARRDPYVGEDVEEVLPRELAVEELLEARLEPRVGVVARPRLRCRGRGGSKRSRCEVRQRRQLPLEGKSDERSEASRRKRKFSTSVRWK